MARFTRPGGRSFPTSEMQLTYKRGLRIIRRLRDSGALSMNGTGRELGQLISMQALTTSTEAISAPMLSAGDR